MENLQKNHIINKKNDDKTIIDKKIFKKEDYHVVDKIDNIDIITCKTCYLDTIRPIDGCVKISCYHCEKKNYDSHN